MPRQRGQYPYPIRQRQPPKAGETEVGKMGIFSEIFTWWQGNTIGTRWYTFRRGVLKGEDEFGNKYYEDKKGDRRWVIYNGESEGSMVPAAWHGWLHHTVDILPTEEDFTPRHWHKPHQPNLTGTSRAYRPRKDGAETEKNTGNYEPWRPS